VAVGAAHGHSHRSDPAPIGFSQPRDLAGGHRGRHQQSCAFHPEREIVLPDSGRGEEACSVHAHLSIEQEQGAVVGGIYPRVEHAFDSDRCGGCWEPAGTWALCRGPVEGPLPGPAAAVATIAPGGGGLRWCSRFGGHAHGSSGDVDARLVGLLGCGGPGPRPIAAAPARWADLLDRRRRRRRRRRRYSARWSGRAGNWLDAGHAGAARRDAGRVLLIRGGATDRQDDGCEAGGGCGDEGDRGRAGAIPGRTGLQDRAPRAGIGRVDGAQRRVSWRVRFGGIPQRVFAVAVPPVRVEPTGRPGCADKFDRVGVRPPRREVDTGVVIVVPELGDARAKTCVFWVHRSMLTRRPPHLRRRNRADWRSVSRWLLVWLWLVGAG